MKHSDSIKNLSSALKNFEVSTITKNAENPFFKSRYATLDNIIENTKVALSELGITILQGASYNPEGLIVETMLLHESGEWIKTETFVPIEKQTPQSAGSAITYGRRYALSAILNLGTDEDDDGNGASKTPTAKINFDSIEKELSKLQTEEEVKNFFIKIKARPDRKDWTAEQVGDMKALADIHLTRVKFKGEVK